MKKVKYITLALVIMLGLIGGAYAYWTDQVVISGTVSTGEMNVEWYQAESQYNGTGGLTTISAEIQDNNKTVLVEIDNLFPVQDVAGRVEFVAGLENMSTIPVKLENLQVALLGVTESDNMVYSLQVARNDGAGWITLLPLTFPFFPPSLSQLENDLRTKLDSIILLPNEKLFFRVGVWLNGNAGNDLIDQPGTITLELDWIQWNAS